MSNIPYLDLHTLAEDDRIEQIGQKAMAGGVIGFITNSDAGKAERYLLKLFISFPELELIDKSAGPVPNTVLCRVRKKPKLIKIVS